MSTNVLGRRLAVNTAVNFASQGTLVAIGLLSTPFIVTHLGPTLFGVLALLFAYVEAFALVDLGVNTSVIKFLAEILPSRRNSEIGAYLGTAVILFASVGILVTIVVVTLAPWLASTILTEEPAVHSSIVIGFWVASAAFLVRFVGQAFAAVPIAAQRFDIANYITIGTEVARVAGTVLALHAGYQLQGVLVSSLVANVLWFGANLLAVRRLLPAGALGMRFSRWHCYALLHFSKFVMVSNLSGRVVHSLDKVILSYFLPAAAIGFYAIAYSLSQKLWMLVGCVTTVIFPAASALNTNSSPHLLTELYLRSNKFVAAIAAFPAFVLWLFGHDLLEFWVGADFAAGSSPVLGVLSWAFLAHCLAHIPHAMAQAIGKPFIAAWFAATNAVLNIVLLVAFVPKFGLLGAAASFLVVQLVLTPFFVYFVSRALQVDLLTLIVRAYSPAAVACLAGGGVCWLLRSLVISSGSLAVVVFAGTFVYAVAVALIVLDARERATLKSMFARNTSLVAAEQ